MGDILKEAIADAKAVRETALENAKMALEEAFTPQIKSMLSAKLKEEEDDTEEEGMHDEGEHDDEAEEGEEREEGEHDDEAEEGEGREEGDMREDDEDEAEEGMHDDEKEEGFFGDWGRDAMSNIRTKKQRVAHHKKEYDKHKMKKSSNKRSF